MSNKEDLEAKREILNAIREQDVVIPGSVPINVYIQEAENLYQWCMEDQEQLVNAGLDWIMVEDLPTRCGALREAQSLWEKRRLSGADAMEQWKTESPKAFELKKRLEYDFRYAFQDRPDLLNRVRNIADETTNAGLVQGLNDLSVLGEDNLDLLAEIKFDAALLVEAANVSDEMATLLALATGERFSGGDEKNLRDRAYTHLDEAVDKIRSCGRYVFHNVERRLKGYRSHYLRIRNSRGDLTPVQSPTEEPAEETAA